MKILFLVDRDINVVEFTKLQTQFKEFMFKHAEIEPTYFSELYDYNNYPTYTDGSGYTRPTDTWLRSITSDVHKRYSGEGTDHVVLLIHEDKWQSGDIWGTNWSNVYNGYQLHYCRFDRDNLANSFGTLWHELHHSIDALCKTYAGVNAASIMAVNDWDADITHGGSDRFGYIRYQENTTSLVKTATHLKTAYAKRDAIYQQKVGALKGQVFLLERVLILFRQLINKSTTQKS